MKVHKCLLLIFLEVPISHCVYPEYYNVTVKVANDEEHHNLSGLYKKMIREHSNYPVYGKINENIFLKHLRSGQWSIGGQFRDEECSMRSTLKGLSLPPESSLWEVKQSHNDTWHEGTVLIEAFEYPQSFVIEYQGDDSQVKSVFEENELSGFYSKKNRNPQEQSLIH